MLDPRYQPPKADVDDVGTEAISTSARTPVAVWLLLAFLLIVAAITGVGAIRFSYRLATVVVPLEDAIPLATNVILRAAAAAAAAFVILKVRRRAPIGRVLGLGVIALVALGLALGLFEGWPGVLSVAAVLGWGIVAVGCLAPIVWWARSFGFSPAARAYFGAWHVRQS